MTEPSRTTDQQRRFGGIARLYGAPALGRFLDAHVAVIGVGGVGSWAVEALARSAIGALTLIDLDHVAESNINRQLPALDATLGRAKVQVLAERIREIHPQCRVHAIEAFVEVGNLEALIPDHLDFVIDCIDNYRVKAALIAHCRRRKMRLVTAGAAGGRSDPTRIRVGDLSRTEQDPLLSKTRKLLRREYGFPVNLQRRFEVPCVWSDEQAVFPAAAGGVCAQRGAGLNCGGFGSAMPVTAGFGLAAAALVLRKLADRA
jgi:tRNA threonylcarbamoyladenosine dehydratase